MIRYILDHFYVGPCHPGSHVIAFIFGKHCFLFGFFHFVSYLSVEDNLNNFRKAGL